MSQSLPLFRAFQRERVEEGILNNSLSQSLPLFRAFQLPFIPVILYGLSLMSQSLPLFRAFQQERLIEHFYIQDNLSQSLPLFRAFQLEKKEFYPSSLLWVAIPSFIQGISTSMGEFSVKRARRTVAIPSFIQGISTSGEWEGVESNITQSQSLPLFRAFQLIFSIWGICFSLICRNPFLYSGHFNNLFGDEWTEGDLEVAIPSFIQGISTMSIEKVGFITPVVVAIPSFIQGISTCCHD